MGSYQSGQLGLTVTQLSFDFGGSNPSLPTDIYDLLILKFTIEIICALALEKAIVNRKLLNCKLFCESSSVDRALAFQAEGRGFESRLSLFKMRDKSLSGQEVILTKSGNPFFRSIAVVAQW